MTQIMLYKVEMFIICLNGLCLNLSNSLFETPLYGSEFSISIQIALGTMVIIVMQTFDMVILYNPYLGF